MLRFRKIVNFINRIKNTLDIDIYIEDGEKKLIYPEHISLEGKINLLSFSKIIETMDCQINVISSCEFTVMEIRIIALLFQEFFSKEEYNKHSPIEKEILKLLNEDLDREKFEKIGSAIGLISTKKVSVMTLELFGDSHITDIISIIDSMGIDNLFVLSLDTDMISVICQPNQGEDMEIAKRIIDTIESEIFVKVKIGIGINRYLHEIRTGFLESLEALRIGKKFGIPKGVFYSKDLTDYKLLSLISDDNLSRLHNYVEELGFDKLEPEDIKTANVFLDSNLNISEAARRLYIHRNTLIYRLDKILKDTEYDLRSFRAAQAFRLNLTILQFKNN